MTVNTHTCQPVSLSVLYVSDNLTTDNWEGCQPVSLSVLYVSDNLTTDNWEGCQPVRIITLRLTDNPPCQPVSQPYTPPEGGEYIRLTDKRDRDPSFQLSACQRLTTPRLTTQKRYVRCGGFRFSQEITTAQSSQPRALPLPSQ